MKRKISFGMIAIMLTTAFLLLSTTSVFAAASDTDAGTTISNLATLNYTLTTGGSFSLESSPTGNSTVGSAGTATSFVVDTKVRPVVTAVTSNTNIFAGGNNQWISFNVTNDGNDDRDFKLSYSKTGAPQNVTETGAAIYYETGASQSYGDGSGTEVNMSSLAEPYVITIPRDTTITVYVLASTVSPASGLSEGDAENYHLIATAWDMSGGSPGAALAQDTDGNDPSQIETATDTEIVFADDAGTLTGDTGLSDSSAPDGRHSAQGTFTFRNVQLTMTKTQTIVYDPYGLGYNLPGVYLQYTIEIENTSTATNSAFLTTINDVITESAASSYSFDFDHVADPGIAGPGTAENAVGNSVHITFTNLSGTRATTEYWRTGGNADSDDVAFNAGTLSIDLAALMPTEDAYTADGELKQGEIITITYNVKIDGTN